MIIEADFTDSDEFGAAGWLLDGEFLTFARVGAVGVENVVVFLGKSAGGFGVVWVGTDADDFGDAGCGSFFDGLLGLFFGKEFAVVQVAMRIN